MAGQNLILKDMFLHVQNFKPPYQAIVNANFLLTQKNWYKHGSGILWRKLDVIELDANGRWDLEYSLFGLV
jgi:hypothetical protein